MSLRGKARGFLLICECLASRPMWPRPRHLLRRPGATVRIVGMVRDETNAIALPGVPVEVVDTKEVTYTDVDGRSVLQVPPGKHTLKVVLEGYQEKSINVDAVDRMLTADVGLTMAKFAETVTVVAQALDIQTSSAEAQLIERRQSSVITDNVGAQEMKDNGDSVPPAAIVAVTVCRGRQPVRLCPWPCDRYSLQPSPLSDPTTADKKFVPSTCFRRF